MKNRYSLTKKGLFPETLPPCFVSDDFQRAMRGIVKDVDEKRFRKRSADYVRYSGTKHDGSRRFYGTPHPIAYHYVSTFIHAHWKKFQRQFEMSAYSVSSPKVLSENSDRAIQVTSLSEVASLAQKRLKYAPFILKTDIAQFFPSIYTHSISWAAHGVAASKADIRPNSPNLPFNHLDFFVRNCQSSQTRGVLVGPDGFRLIAEFVATSIDNELNDAVGDHIVGAVRHVDDFYVGLKSEADALIVLSRFREVLQRYELQINDAKTKIFGSLEPINDLWAQELRRANPGGYYSSENLLFFLDKALQLSSELKTASPIKIALRNLDQMHVYRSLNWSAIEGYLQRICYHYPRCIDYIALLVVKRCAIGEIIDEEGWLATCSYLIERHIAFNHHHEILWLVWLMLACKLPLTEPMVGALCKTSNAHILSLVAFAHTDGRMVRKPPIKFATKLSSSDSSWLLNLVARSCDFCRAAFSGDYASGFEHLAGRKLKLIDIESYVESLSVASTRAISRTRYGYDDDEREAANDDEEDVDFALESLFSSNAKDDF